MSDPARLVEMLGAIADSANGASSAEEAFRAALEEICEATGWAGGRVHAVGPQGELTDIGTRHTEDTARVGELSGRETGAAGASHASGSPEWVQGVCAIPVLAGTETLAILELFSDDDEPPDALVLDALQTVGVIAGRVVERARAEDELRRVRSESEKPALAETAAPTAPLDPGSLRDTATGLLTPTYLEEALRIETARAERGRRAVTVIVLAADEVPALRSAGRTDLADAAIHAIAEFLRTKVRKGDLAARYDDEFVVVLPGVSVGMGRVRTQQLRKGAEALGLVGADGTTLGASAGFACFPDHGGSEMELLESARVALHKAQGEGGAKLQMAEPSLARWTKKR